MEKRHGRGRRASETEGPARGEQEAALLVPVPARIFAVAAGVALLGWGVARILAHRPIPCGWGACNVAELYRFYAIIGPGAAVALLLVYFLYPRALAPFAFLRSRWRPQYSYAALAATCAAFFAFIVHFGNRQFGGFDLSVLIDTGWRLASGQKPYSDFVCTPPPGFYLGLKYAFQLFGVRWDAQLYAASLYACASFLWMYYLLGALLETRAAAYLTALAIECASMLLLSFWWYNNITSIAACIFFFSCFLCLHNPNRRASWLSYAGSLVLLGLMKPNTAGLLGLGGVALVFVASRRRPMVVVLTLVAAAGAILALAINGVSLGGMLTSYRKAAIGRGGLSTFGFFTAKPLDVFRDIVCVMALAAPLSLWERRFAPAIRRVDLRQTAIGLLLLLGPAVSVFAMFSNGELKDVEWPLFIASGALLLFGASPLGDPAAHGRLRRFYVAFLCSLMAADLYMGAVRYRVEEIGYQMYFEWRDASHPVSVPFFSNLKASGRFQTVVEEVRQALKENPGPVFFGPSMEFAYAAFGVPSPMHLPAWWDPGTSFARADEPALLKNWLNHHFAMLIFLKNDFTYYSPAFLSLIQARYSRDERYSELTIFHVKDAPGSR
jgi:hypothetical protein